MTVVVQPPLPIGWRFWIYWMLATIASAAVFMIAMLPLNAIMATATRLAPGTVAPGGVERWLALAVASFSSTLLGAFFGLGQWLVLRKYLPGSGWWVIATLVGYSVPFVSGMLYGARMPLGPVIMALEFGLGLGVLQWLVLRRRVHQAGWWIPISIAGWALAFGLTGAFYLAGLYVEPMDMLFAFLIPVAVAGAGLVWLLRRTAQAGQTGV